MTLRAGWRLARLSSHPRRAARVLASFLELFVRYHARRPITGTRRVPLAEDLEFRVRDHTEVLVLYEVFVDECYAHPALPVTADVVVDLGCNIGAASAWFGRRYPGSRVVGVEADPETAALAARNTASAGIEIVNYAVARTSGTAAFARSSQASWASSLASDGDDEVVHVPALSLADLYQRIGTPDIDVLKIDVEGAEHDLFDDADSMEPVGLIVGEYHPRDGASWEAFAGRFVGFVATPVQTPGTGALDFVAVRSGGPGSGGGDGPA